MLLRFFSQLHFFCFGTGRKSVNNNALFLKRYLNIRISMLADIKKIVLRLSSAFVLSAALALSPGLFAQPEHASLAEETAQQSAADFESDAIALADISPEQEMEEADPLVAPNVDLSEVAPVPEPIATPDESDTEDAGAEDSTVDIVDETTDGEDEPAAVILKPSVEEEDGSFVILGAEVQRATSTRLAWSPGSTITGLSLPTPVLVINGAEPGPTLCLTSAVHGDELNGIEIVRRVMYNIDPTRLHGKIVGVPIVNLQGFQRGTRYLPDRRDLNRFFPGDPNGSLASRIAHSFFNEVVTQCDLLVDLHTGSLGRTNLPQLRADMNNSDIAAFTEGFDKMVVVHSPGSPGMLRTAAADIGIVSVTMEVGESLRVQEDDIRVGVNSIYSLMEKQEMFSRRFVWGNPAPVYYASFWLRVESGGLLFSTADLGDTVYKGQILGTVTDPITNESTDVVAPVRGRIIGMAVDQVVMPGFAAYHIGKLANERTILDPKLPDDQIGSGEPSLEVDINPE